MRKLACCVALAAVACGEPQTPIEPELVTVEVPVGRGTGSGVVTFELEPGQYIVSMAVAGNRRTAGRHSLPSTFSVTCDADRFGLSFVASETLVEEWTGERFLNVERRSVACEVQAAPAARWGIGFTRRR